MADGSIWTRVPTLDTMKDSSTNTAVESLGIEYVAVGDDSITARMPVDKRTHQPFGLLHGGASVLLAETLGSIAANHCIRDPDKVAVGLEINANHLRSVRSGWVTGTTRPIHIGGATQVWEIRIEDDKGKLVCVSRITMAVIPRPRG